MATPMVAACDLDEPDLDSVARPTNECRALAHPVSCLRPKAFAVCLKVGPVVFAYLFGICISPCLCGCVDLLGILSSLLGREATGTSLGSFTEHRIISVCLLALGRLASEVRCFAVIAPFPRLATPAFNRYAAVGTLNNVAHFTGFGGARFVPALPMHRT